MIIETRLGSPVRLTHQAAFYTGADDALDTVVSLVTEALDRAEPVAIIVEPETERGLRARVGAAAEVIVMPRPDPLVRVSGQTVAALRARELRDLASVTGTATVVTQHSPRLDGLDGSYWTELDAAVNVALADIPITMTCLYPDRPMHREITGGVQLNHPWLLLDGRPAENPEHRGAAEVLTMIPAPALPSLGPADRQLSFTAFQLPEVRVAVAEAARISGLSTHRIEDAVLAVNEVATNAVEHGAGSGELLLWTGKRGLSCEVQDRGLLTDPLPGLQPPHPSDPRGRGVWIARQLCDLLHVWADGSGTHVRIHTAG